MFLIRAICLMLVMYAGMHESLYGMTNALLKITPEHKEKSKKLRDLQIQKADTDFCDLAAKNNLYDMYGELIRTPYISLWQIDRMLDDKQLAMRTARVPTDVQSKIVYEIFDGHEDACTKFTTDSYAQASLKLACIIEGIEKNPISFLNIGDRYSASPDLRKIYTSLHDGIGKGKRPNISLYDEYIIRTQMPPHVANRLQLYSVWCQKPYMERMLPALKAGLWTGSKFLGLGIAPMLIPGSLRSTTLNFVHDVFPEPLRHIGGMYQTVLVLSIEGYLDLIGKFVGINSSNVALLNLYRALLMPAAIIAGSAGQLMHGDAIFCSSEGMRQVVSTQLICGAVGTAYGLGSSLYEQSNQYPIRKAIGAIKNISASN